jgi:hypothetical protein
MVPETLAPYHRRPHPDMKFDPALLRTIANTTGFPPDHLEKLLRLRELLTEFHKHPSFAIDWSSRVAPRSISSIST